MPAFDRSGTRVAWESTDENLVPRDLNLASDIFVHDVASFQPGIAGRTYLASAAHPSRLAESGGALSRLFPGSLSGNGRFLAMVSFDSNLFPDDANRYPDLVVRDLLKGTNLPIGYRFISPAGSDQPYPFGTNSTIATNYVSSVVMSGDGRFLASVRLPISNNPNLIARSNVFRADTSLGTNAIVAQSTIEPFSSFSPALSWEGRYLAFETESAVQNLMNYYPTSLDVSDRNSSFDILLRDYDVMSNRVQVVSVNRFGTNTGNGASRRPVFSANDRWIAFESAATDLVSNYPGGTPGSFGLQLFARDWSDRTTRWCSYLTVASPDAGGVSIETPIPGGATNPVFSLDGRYLFFGGTTNRTIYRHDLLAEDAIWLTAGETVVVTNRAKPTNTVVCAGCGAPSVNADGRYVAYESRPTTGGATNVFLKDIESGQAELISISLTGTNGNGSSFTPLLRHDARFVVFASKASDLVPGDSNRATDIFVRDRWARVTHALSRNLAGIGTGNRVSSNPILSADGRTVAFQSFASDLVAGDYNDTRDVFVVTLGGPDRDGDTMEDDWELAYFNTLDRDGSGDFDQDGASDLAEFRAGTNPANDGSILRVLRLTTGVAAGAEESRTTVILWSAVPGRTYRVESKADLDAAWTSIGADVVASTVSASVAHTVGGDEVVQPHRFYRVVLVQ